MDNVVHLCSRTVLGKVFVACALGCLFGCGTKKGAPENTTSDDAIKTPATVEQAARVLDLSTFRGRFLKKNQGFDNFAPLFP
jgi:hypothetical protein